MGNLKENVKLVSFNNLKTTIEIESVNYSGIFIYEDKKLFLELTFTDLEHFDQDLNFICGSINKSGVDYTIIRGINHSSNYSYNSKLKTYTVKFLIDRLLYGKKTNIIDKIKTEKIEVKYSDLNFLSHNIPRDKSTTIFYIETKKELIQIKLKNNQKDSIVEFKFKRPQTYNSIMSSIYTFRSFISLLTKKDFTVENQTVFIENHKYEILDGFQEQNKIHNQPYELHLKHTTLKLEDINNLNEVYSEFKKLHNELHPFLDLYHNAMRYNIPQPNAFLNYVMLLEYYSRTFDSANVISITSKRNPNINNLDFHTMVRSLMINVNQSFNFTAIRINRIATNMNNARLYYVHYLKKPEIKKLSNIRINQYTYFLQDLILLNLYQLIKIDVKLNQSSLLDVFYNQNDLTNKI